MGITSIVLAYASLDSDFSVDQCKQSYSYQHPNCSRTLKEDSDISVHTYARVYGVLLASTFRWHH
jgi:hypothetical protein